VREFLSLFELVLATTLRQAAAPVSGKSANPQRVARAAAR